MECLGDVSWENKGAGGARTAATKGGVLAKLTILIIIRNIWKSEIFCQIDNIDHYQKYLEI